MTIPAAPAPAFTQRLTGAAWAGLKAFVIAFAAMSVAGVALAVVSFLVLDSHSRLVAAIAAFFAVLEGIVAGALLGSRHASSAAAAHALGHLRLGAATVRFVFDRVLGISGQMAPGSRGERLVEAGNRIPLAQAERLVTEKIDDLSKTAPAPGWLANKVRSRVLGAVRAVTLSRCREANAHEGGIDLLKLKNELETTIDDRLVAKFKGGLTLWTIAAIVGLPATVAGQTLVAWLLLNAHR